ncbi:unnamed protein product [Cuscuta campestris]|uniref:Transmembrane protein n=1 Tax=Cuscuta campestris TaxID=132261 RepID=A0A484N6Y2_9ASTE|nr:unnamed protein product [Cuscuta campestris]
MLKKTGHWFTFKRLTARRSTGGDGRSAGLRWRLKTARRPSRFLNWFLDGVLFRFVSFVEAVVLVSRLAFFFLCCGCRF